MISPSITIGLREEHQARQALDIILYMAMVILLANRFIYFRLYIFCYVCYVFSVWVDSKFIS